VSGGDSTRLLTAGVECPNPVSVCLKTAVSRLEVLLTTYYPSTLTNSALIFSPITLNCIACRCTLHDNKFYRSRRRSTIPPAQPPKHLCFANSAQHIYRKLATNNNLLARRYQYFLYRKDVQGLPNRHIASVPFRPLGVIYPVLL
jgi:hypothetical protein